ncbi:MAG: MarR family transcriptional regulator [Gammaproteobacteria bacterium]|nr:MarR family transcriptional regulator [Gammaproteobacteria bacterium]
MAMIYLTEGIDRPSALAEKLRVSKQATQQALKELQAKAIVEL